SAHRDAIPRLRLDPSERGEPCGEARARAGDEETERRRHLRALPAPDRPDLPRRRRADVDAALPPPPWRPPVSRANAVRYHREVTRFLRQFLVRGVFWRQLLHWAVLNIPFW